MINKKFNPENLIKPVSEENDSMESSDEELDDIIIEEGEIVEEYELLKPVATKEWAITESTKDKTVKILTLYADVNTPVASIRLDEPLVKTINKTTNYVPVKKKSFWGPMIAITLAGIMFAIVFLGSALNNLPAF